jgi:hypothetical protein
VLTYSPRMTRPDDPGSRMAPAVAPYGSWPSPITAEVLVADTVRISDLRVAGGAMWWVEGRPAEGGRHVVVRRRPDGTVDDLLAAPRSARTTVQEYGGAPFTTDADGTTVWFSDFADQRLWRVDAGGEPRPVTPSRRSWRPGGMPTHGSWPATGGSSPSGSATTVPGPTRW